MKLKDTAAPATWQLDSVVPVSLAVCHHVHVHFGITPEHHPRCMQIVEHGSPTPMMWTMEPTTGAVALSMVTYTQ
jgi:hypothetical protein